MATPIGSTSRRWTLSNGLSLLRLLAAPLFCAATQGEAWILALVLFWAAVASDWADGRLARARGESSAFGGLLDHASDAVFVLLALSVLSGQGRVPGLLPVLVGLAFVLYVVDSRVFAGRPLRTHPWGRWNGILYFVPPGVVVTREALGLEVPADEIVRAVGWALAVSTLGSMTVRVHARLAERSAIR